MLPRFTRRIRAATLWRGSGAPAASISLVRFGNDVGFLGLYICQPEHRGRGVGFALFQAAIARLAPGITGLDGVPEQQANYSRSGFRFSYRTIRHEGALARLAPDRTRPLEASDLDAALAVARSRGMAPVSETARMWRGPAPVQDLDSVFGVSTLELGSPPLGCRCGSVPGGGSVPPGPRAPLLCPSLAERESLTLPTGGTR
ncbi:MAG: GNAT family N-acetyltransferase [Rhodobacteraceae bacterium]|nr:GNAT family N-acetyltransferase [Paracoccaceae bacterium]